MKPKPSKIISVLMIAILVLILAACSGDVSAPTQSEHPLPTIGNIAKLKKLVNPENRFVLFGFQDRLESVEENQLADASKEHSTTNVQVKGIDESDIVKTDGKYLYQVSGHQIVITKLYPIDEAGVINIITMEDNYYPREIYIDGNILVVLGYGNDDEIAEGELFCGMGFYFPNNTVVHVYDISSISSPKLMREVEIEGHLLTSRKKDNYLYLVINKYIGYAEIQENPAPKYYDSSTKNQRTQKSLDQIHYFPEGDLSGFITIAAIDLKSHNKQVTIETFLGNGNNIYMSHNNLYIALTTNNQTIIHKFQIDKSSIKYKSQGKVDGWVLNQFSMDEYEGYFRIATTSHQDEMTNNLYVLDENMKIVGKLENLAPTERIYAARFMGEKAYLITFEIVDPLFVIDLANPKSPKVLGELKIPGFSNYLHPIDENHLLGIGRDTKVTTLHGREVAIELGIRLTIFDVTDVNDPKEKFVETIGGRGSYSEALFNHKAIYYHNNRLAFPVWVTEKSGSHEGYNEVEFIGAYIYEIDTAQGFHLENTISHLTIEESNNFYENENHKKYIHRVVSIGEYLYTISEGMIQIHDENFETIKSIKID